MFFTKKAKIDKDTGNKKFTGFVKGSLLVKNSDNSEDKIIKVIENDIENYYELKKFGGPVTKGWIFKYYRLGYEYGQKRIIS